MSIHDMLFDPGESKPRNAKATRKLPRKRSRQQVVQTFFPQLDDIHLTNYRHAAVYIGDFFEEATERFFSSSKTSRLMCDSTAEVCPDLQQSRGEFYIESKGLRRGGHTNLFVHQMEHYRQLLDMYFPPSSMPDPDFDPHLIFAIWIHKVKPVHTIHWREELRDKLSQSVDHLYLLDFSVMESIVKPKRVEDWSRCGYRPLVRMQERELRLYQPEPSLLPDYLWGSSISNSLKVYGRTVAPFPVTFLLRKTIQYKASLSHILKLLTKSTPLPSLTPDPALCIIDQ